MKRLLALFVLIMIPGPSTALADGCPPSTCGITSSALPASPVLYLRPSGQQGPLRVFLAAAG